VQISFQNKTAASALKAVSSGLSNWDFGKNISLDLGENLMTITIKKMGTSKISFNVVRVGKMVHFLKKEEKIAISHRPIRSVIESKLISIVKENNGSVSH